MIKTHDANSATTKRDQEGKKKIRMGLSKIKELKNTKSNLQQVGGKNSGSLIAPTGTSYK